MIHLILGGARSGKSNLAEKLALQAYEQSLNNGGSNESLFYLATSTQATPADIGEEESAQYEDMQARIEHHQQQRDQLFFTIEEPIAISDILLNRSEHSILLLDCLTLWLSNCLMQGYSIEMDAVDLNVWRLQRKNFLQALENTQGQILLVSNEVGQGVVPLGRLSRIFVDEAGRLHQDIARIADKVSFVTAGIAQQLK